MFLYQCLLLVIIISDFSKQKTTALAATTWEPKPTWATSPATTAKVNLIRENRTDIPLVFETKGQTTNMSSNSTKEYGDPSPIMITVTPNVTVFEGNGVMTCSAVGSNLPKIKPYYLIWFEQGQGGFNNVIIKENNSRFLVLNNNLLKKYRGKTVFCALNFNNYSPKHYWSIETDYIHVANFIPNTGPSMTLIASMTGVACFIILVLLFGVLYKRFNTRNFRAPPISEEPSAVSQENIYTYIPIQRVPFYEAKSMVAANMKLDTIKREKEPPALPARLNHQTFKTLSEDVVSFGRKNSVFEAVVANVKLNTTVPIKSHSWIPARPDHKTLKKIGEDEMFND